MDKRRGKVQREKRQQQLRTLAKMTGGRDEVLHSEFMTSLSFSPCFLSHPFFTSVEQTPSTHTHAHTQIFERVCLIVEARGTLGSIRRLLCISLSHSSSPFVPKGTLPLPVTPSTWVVGVLHVSQMLHTAHCSMHHIMFMCTCAFVFMRTCERLFVCLSVQVSA